VLAHEGQGDVRGVLAPVAAVPVGATELATAESALAPTTAGERALPEAGVMPMAIARRRVLFVDDSLSVRKVAERMLARLDVEVVTAVDGLDALDKLRAMPVSLVFTDLEMPRLHGYDLIREMQIQPAYRPIPVVVISSRSGQRHIDQALAMGAREYLTKPFTPEVLQDAIERLALSALEERLLS
jgi:chemosensory pili system protein ChpA (sensor histidine kinase/response regulator)